MFASLKIKFHEYDYLNIDRDSICLMMNYYMSENNSISNDAIFLVFTPNLMGERDYLSSNIFS